MGLQKSLLSTQIYPAVAMNNTLYKSEAELSLELMVANWINFPLNSEILIQLITDIFQLILTFFCEIDYSALSGKNATFRNQVFFYVNM